MKAECCLKNDRLVKTKMKNKTKCMICENTVFRVCRITPELVMLTCENCGENHMMGTNVDERGTHLAFWSAETLNID